MRYYFGKDLTVFYTYGEDAAPVGSPTIYLFEDKPSRDVAQAGTGALATINTWTSDPEIPNTKNFTVSAIDDSDIDDTSAGKDYFLAINYVLKATEQTQTDIKRIHLVRPGGSITHHGVDVDAVIAAYPTLSSYLTDADIEDQIALAIDELKSILQPKIDWDKVVNKDRLYFPILCKAISNSCLSEFDEEGDKWHTRWNIFEKKYSDFMAAYLVEADQNVSGDADTNDVVGQDFLLNHR